YSLFRAWRGDGGGHRWAPPAAAGSCYDDVLMKNQSRRGDGRWPRSGARWLTPHVLAERPPPAPPHHALAEPLHQPVQRLLRKLGPAGEVQAAEPVQIRAVG